MTTSLSEAPAPATTSTSPTARQLWTRSRALLAAALAVLVFGIGYAALRSGESHGALDPRSADPAGSRAVAQLLAAQGVTTSVVTTTDEAAATLGRDTTLLVAVPDLLTPHQQSLLHSAAEQSGGSTVLLSPGPTATDALAPGVQAIAPTKTRTLTPGCSLPSATRAGDVELGGVEYATSVPAADTCYPSGGHPTLIRLPAANDGDIVVLGSAGLLTNDRLGEQGNASLALQLLGAHPKLVWYLPSLSDASALDGSRKSFFDLIPHGWTWGLLQLLIAAVLAALWRARRLGPVIAERLPVAVHASESTEGRAHLYRRANARARAAEALRQATRDRLAPIVGISPAPAPEALTDAVAALLGTAGADGAGLDPGVLLYGPPPSDDAALLRLADDLDALERRITSTERYATP
ncbi:DUF4350 domain-containing protein [Streptomyces sp. H10-C2]|uniref:DUF4350 domain-containing protein n=1 Tax=unclassified Streptomyces TaxID=2593676 RepID=UPI0024B91002|nr:MULTISPECIES: DUF4350 domain-containing protein [unclassified Streptomyces]MDJ0345741.1 DUF4350 domain-containing protein [Streptomyces sp. PH10-H1]MDJ0374566.1 DUF4350 domain-containing protein [Streptomyces sp. H10-C2]